MPKLFAKRRPKVKLEGPIGKAKWLRTREGKVLVSEADFERCRRHSWRMDGEKVFSWAGSCRIPLANFILESPKGEKVYFANGNKRDFRRENLRCSRLNPEDRLLWTAKRSSRVSKIRVPEWWRLVQEIDWEAKNELEEKNDLGLPKAIFCPLPGPIDLWEKTEPAIITPRQSGYTALRNTIEKRHYEHVFGKYKAGGKSAGSD